MPKPQELASEYNIRKKEIMERLGDFEQVWQKGKNKELFAELCFCLLTPQSSAIACDKAVKRMLSDNALFGGNEAELRKKVFPIRFYRNKSRHIFLARKQFSVSGELKLKEILLQQKIETDSFFTREWLVKNVKGLGYKEASHFLRNIGFGKQICILDRHILKNLQFHGAIKEIPKTLTKKKYLEIEKQMLAFSKKIKIHPAELDLLFWSNETGKIFK